MPLSKRRQPVSPLGTLSTSLFYRFRCKLTADAAVSHCTEVDNIYEGQYIPAGTIIMGNAWYAVFLLVLFHCLF